MSENDFERLESELEMLAISIDDDMKRLDEWFNSEDTQAAFRAIEKALDQLK